MKIQNFAIVLIVIAILLLVAHFADLWVLLGAHPRWSGTTTYIGIASGAIATVIAYATLPRTPKSTMFQALGFTILALLSIAASTYGQRAFAASYADDAQAGQIWYFGFITFIFAIYGALAALSRFVRRNSST